MNERLQGLPPVIGRNARLLILGSFPGVASLRAQQYYGHPRNQFWPLLSAIWGVDLVAAPYHARLAELRRRGLGLWDVYASCLREGGLQLVAHNGGESARAMRHIRALGLPVRRLPSCSPANASWSFERKLLAWREAFQAAGLCA